MMDQDMSIHFLIPQLFVFALILMVVVVTYLERSRREKHRVELQKAVLERVGSVKDFAEFLTTEQGERFLASLAPAQFTPLRLRSVGSVRFGIIALTVGVFLMGALHSTVFGSFGKTPPPPLLLGSLLLVAIGIGTLLAAVVSFAIARVLGVNGRGGSKKDDAV